ncbi:MAG: OmpH family outer membrane protein [Bacteroidetes bacterium]|nr:MAG: OmpH family outer membrane protein [Bacteroidota bacterium]
MKYLKTLLLATALFIGSTSYMNAQSNVAHIDTQALIDAMPKAITARGELEKLAKTYENDIRSMVTELETKVKQYDAEASTKTDEENAKRVQEVGEFRTSIQQYQGQAQQDLQKKEQELFTPIYEEVKTAIQKVGKAQGFQYILDSREGAGTLLMAEGKDLLADVKKELGF